MADAVVKAVVGLRRYGKSSHVVRLIEGTRRVVFFDTLNDDYNEGIICREWPVFQKLWLASYRGPFRITYKPTDPLEHFAEFCNMAYACGDCTIVIDEVQLYFRGASCCSEFTKLITAGGHAQVEMIGVTQMPKRLGEVLRSQAHEWHIFALREEGHVKYVVDRCPGIEVSVVKTLPKYEYLHFVDGADYCWQCKDNLETGETERRRLENAETTVKPEQDSNPGDDENPSEPMERKSADGVASLPSSPGEGNSVADRGPSLLST